MPDLSSKKILISLLLIQALIIMISFYQLKSAYPFFMYPPRGTDMLTLLTEARDLLDGMFPAGQPYTHVFFYIYVLAGILMISMKNIIMARFIQALSLLIITFMTYLIAKKVFNKKVALISGLISI